MNKQLVYKLLGRKESLQIVQVKLDKIVDSIQITNSMEVDIDLSDYILTLILAWRIWHEPLILTFMSLKIPWLKS